MTYLNEHMAFSWLPDLAAALEDLRRHEDFRSIRPLQVLPEFAVPQRSRADRLLAQLARPLDGIFLAAGHLCLIDDEIRSFRLREDRVWTSPANTTRNC